MKAVTPLPHINSRYASMPFRLICFALGKADAFLITTPQSAVLIDTGSEASGKQLTQHLSNLGVTSLDFLILTHFDADHIGGVSSILKKIQVKQLLQSPIPGQNKESRQYHAALKKYHRKPDSVRSIEQFLLDGVLYTIFPPQKRHYPSDERNNASLIVHLRHGGSTFLFTADAKEARIKEFLALHPGHCDFLKVPHHGRYQKALPDLIQAVSPRFSVITSGNDKKEDRKTLAVLRQAGCQIALTRKGTAVYFSDANDLFPLP